MERTTGEFIQFDSILGDLNAGDPGSGAADRFTEFSGTLARELAPRNLLERVLADRVILSAWTMQMIAETELNAIGNPRARGCFEELLSGRAAAPGLDHVDVSPQGIALVADCLGKALELFQRIRTMALAETSQPAPAATDDASDFDSDFESDFDASSDFDSDPDTVFDVDSELVDDDLPDLSNEWPIVPRGRSVEDQPEGDTDDRDRPATSAEPLAGRWEGRLGFDLTVSEDSPVIKGTWVTVSQVISLIVDGWSWSDILRTHPELTEDDIRICLAYTVAEEEGNL